MTELLYFADTFLFDCTARVVSVSDSQAKGCKTAVVLDRTCMHPQGGGQPADNGLILSEGTSFSVRHVTKTAEGIIEHHGEFTSRTGFQSGEAVTVAVDRDRRLFNARNHTAGHLLDYALDMLDYRLVGGSGYHFPDGAYVDAVIEPPLPKDINLQEFGQQVEAKLNELVSLGLSHLPHERPPRELPERTQALLSDFVKDSPSVRVMVLECREHLMLPCGGTHATNTAQIGPITIRKVTYKQGKGTVKFAYKVLPNDEVEPKLVY